MPLSVIFVLLATRIRTTKIAIHCVSELPAMTTDSTRTAIARRAILSSTPVMRMLMTMLLMLTITHNSCAASSSLTDILKTVPYDPKFEQLTAPYNSA